MTELLEIIDGRTVAVVGNGEVERDCSAEVDACDIVIRFNHFYNYDSGKTGRRVDVVIQTFTSVWASAKERHADVIRAQHARIFCAKKPWQYCPAQVAELIGPDVCVSDWSKELEPYAKFTTGTAFLAWLASRPRNAVFKVFGFPRGEAADRYYAGDAKSYQPLKDEELALQERSIAMLERQTVTRPRMERPPAVVIPVKACSEGAPGKNDVLLGPCIEKLKPLGYPIHLVGDAERLMGRFAGPGVETFLTPAPTGEVTDDLRVWRDHTGYHGEVVLVQCTSPGLRAEWIGQVLEARRHAPVAATCVKVAFKVNGMYAEENGVWTQLVPNFGPPSVPRQKLPSVIHLSGAVWAFHSDALDRPSFYQAGPLRPVIVSEADSLDVDTPEQLADARRALENRPLA